MQGMRFGVVLDLHPTSLPSQASLKGVETGPSYREFVAIAWRPGRNHCLDRPSSQDHEP